MKPLVSIMIPVYNRENLISETINSALSQDYENIEVVITDNCSSDSTWEVLKTLAKRDSRIKIFQNQTNLGPVGNWRVCAEKCRGEYVKILWSDDLIAPSYVSETIPYFRDEVGFVMSDFLLFNGGSDEIRLSLARKIKDLLKGVVLKRVLKSSDYIGSMLDVNCHRYAVSPGCGIFRAKDLRNALSIDIPDVLDIEFKKTGAGNDLYVFLMIAKEYDYVVCLHKRMSYFRSHPNSITIQGDGQIATSYDLSKLYFIREYGADYVTYASAIQSKIRDRGCARYLENSVI